MPAGTLDQGVDDLGPQGRARRVAVGFARGVAEHGGAKLDLVAPDLGDAIPPFDQDVVNVVARRCEQVQVIEPLRHQAGVEHALGVDHVFLGVSAGLAEGLAGLTEQLPLGRALAAGQVLGHHDRRQDRADLDLLVEERGRVADGLFAAAGDDRVGEAQKQPAAVGVARSRGRRRNSPRRREPPRR